MKRFEVKRINKRILMTMKKSIFISLCMVMAATAVLTSCKKDNDTVSFRATISTYQNNGKVYIDDNRFANWIDEDEVLINGAPYTVEVEGSGDNRIASINGVRAVEEGGYYAIYPSECALTTPPSGFPQILLPQVQVYIPDNEGHQRVEAPMAAYCSADRAQAGLDFTNLCALLKVELDEPMEVGYITVSSSNKPLWGRASISINSTTNLPTISSPEIASLYATDNTVTLDCTPLGLHHEGSGASSGVRSRGPFYIVLPPATNVADLTVSIYVFTGNNSSENRRTITKYTKSTTNSITIVSNKIYGIGDGLDDFEEEENAPDVPFPKLGSGEFSVAGTNNIWGTNYRSTKKVRFALGNLQYYAATNTWRIAENQWDHLGTANSNIGEQYNGWIDLFGYGTSGYTYMPWRATSGNNAYNLYAQGNITNTNHDWGVNPLSNGGNQPEKWRTLTQAELYHLFNDRGGRTGVYGTVAEKLHHTNVSVHGVSGMIVLPDNFPWNTAPYNSNDYWDNITNDKWTDLEGRGAVFFPITGQRSGTSLRSGTSNQGCYWTSTCDISYDPKKPYALHFTSNGETTDNTDYNYYGNAVRLVRDVN